MHIVKSTKIITKMRRRFNYRAEDVSTHDKRALACMYYPDNTEERAVQRLRESILRCPELHDALHHLGYRPKMRTFTPAQVALLFDYLGEP